MIVDSVLRIEIPELSKKQWEQLETKLTFVNDEGAVVSCYRRQITKGNYILPRGAWAFLPDSIRYKDRRTFPPMPKVKFKITLDDVEKDERFRGQKAAVAAMLEHEQGLVIRPPGTGKTQIALAFAAQCQTRTLVLVHTEDILNQWVEYAGKALPGTEIGIIRGKTCTIGHITIATVQTMQRHIRKPKEWWAQFGCLIADEAHHVSAASWEAVINACPARYRFGFTASPTRADGMHPTMKFIIGPIIHRQRFSSPIKLDVVPVKPNSTHPSVTREIGATLSPSWSETPDVTSRTSQPSWTEKLKKEIRYWYCRAALSILSLLLTRCATMLKSLQRSESEARRSESKSLPISNPGSFDASWQLSLPTKLLMCRDSIVSCLHTLESMRAGSFSRSDVLSGSMRRKRRCNLRHC